MNAGSLSVIKRVLSAFSRDELSQLMATLRQLTSAQEVVSAWIRRWAIVAWIFSCVAGVPCRCCPTQT